MYTETKIIIGLIAVFLLIAVVSYLVYEPVLVAICVGLIVTALLYHFFGGTKESKFKLKAFKAGGSVAVFAFVALFVYYGLQKQPYQDTTLKAELEPGAVRVMKEKHDLGKINSESISELGLFNWMEMNQDKGIWYSDKLNAGAKWDVKLYPYEVQTITYGNDSNSFSVLDNKGKLVLEKKSLETREFLFFEHGGDYFLIFVSRAKHNDPKEKPWAVFGFTQVKPILRLDNSSDQ